MNNFKEWIIEVAIKKMGPSLIKGAIAAGLGIMAAHQGLLNSLGITWDGAGHCISIDLDTLGAWALVACSGSIMALFTGIQHHTAAAVTGAPQSGNPALEQRRVEDPPKP
jgi:hypothetical protein